jgi:HEAT repeat protein
MPLAKSEKPALRIIGLHALATAGGSQALAAVRDAIADKEGSVQDEAVRTLSTWPNKWPEDTEVVAPLLELAKSGKKPAHRILALRGYLQYVQGTKKLSGKARMARIDAILPLVTRAEEKRLVVSALGSMGTPEALAKLVGFVDDPQVTEEAASAIVNLERRRMLRKVPKEQRKKALQTVVENSKSGRTRKRAADLLKGVR